ncbi:MAG TPA: four helix bundle protein [Chthoniobacterales bacterium]
MNAERRTRNAELKQRTFEFGLRVVRLVQSLPKTASTTVLGRQLLRCGTSVGANYRAATRGRSRADFIAKLGIAEEECDETIYWIDMLTPLKLIRAQRTQDLRGEAEQLLAIMVSSIKTARRNKE